MEFAHMALAILLSIGPRQFYDDDIPGLRYEDPPNNWNEGLQFLNDETPREYPPGFDFLFEPNPPEEPSTLTCEENEVV
jgi:hypothetical protein